MPTKVASPDLSVSETSPPPPMPRGARSVVTHRALLPAPARSQGAMAARYLLNVQRDDIRANLRAAVEHETEALRGELAALDRRAQATITEGHDLPLLDSPERRALDELVQFLPHV